MAKDDCIGKWTVCSPETVGGFSATAYFFGREIHRELKVPVGLINSSVGGTPIESWIDAERAAVDSGIEADSSRSEPGPGRRLIPRR